MLKGNQGFQRKEIEKLVEWLRQEPTPDIVSLPYSLLLGLAQPLRSALNRPIFCTLQGEDLFLEGLQEPYRSESLDLIRSHIKHVDAFIAVSDYYARFMPDYLGIPSEKISVVPLGINLEGYEAREQERSRPFSVGFFARIAPEKGLHVLAEAYQTLRENGDLSGSRLEVAGYLAPEHRSYLSDIERKMRDCGLADEFHYRGALDRQQKIQFLRGLDVLSVPAVYKEPKGVFLLEAMACGVPVVQPRHGAFTEIVEKTSGGILIEPGSPRSLAAGISQIFHDPALGNELGRNGFHGVREHYSVARMADAALDAYESVVSKEKKTAEAVVAI
jgi:glycosyltransferase involved in cell wall biosynthesis